SRAAANIARISRLSTEESHSTLERSERASLESAVSFLALSIITVVAAYVIGSLPTGFLVAKAKGIDIRTVGSGNIGATNALRTVGKPAGVLVLLVDVAKGWFAVWATTTWVLDGFAGAASTANQREIITLMAGLWVIVGHNYTCWLGFKGGKGIATTAGVLLALAPGVLGIVLGVWMLGFAATRYVSLASISAAVALPLAAWLRTHRPWLTLAATAMSALAIFKHKPNIQRLRNGTEHRFGAPKPPQPDRPAP
ncbi:MAG: glycerol-3-phosphate 1-O-acyltransferase PlsY, partial [Verrucomicrobia bacterium]|nr:glycerol-3-phosphate 1-O-acyltransferase PlsY [Verrucomicrobiota bacterium]